MLPSEDEIEQMVLSMSLQEEKIRQQQQEITELKQEVTRLKNQIRNLQHVSQPLVSSFSPVTLPSHNSLHLSRSASSGRINVRNSNVDVMHQYPNNIINNNSSPMRRSNQLPSTPLAEQSRIVKEFEEKKQRIRSSKLSRSDNDSINSGSSSCRSSSNTNYFSGLTFFRSPQNANQISLHPLGILSPDNRSRHSTSTSSSSSTSPHYGRGSRPQPSCSIDLDRELAFQLQYETSPLEEDLENHLFSSEHNHHNDDRHQVVDPFSYLNTHPVPDLNNNNNNRDLVNNTLDADENRYDVLIQLEDVKVGVKPEMMRLLRSMPFSDSYGINKDCCICFNNFSMKEMVTCLPCKHQYHNHCIMKWFKDHHTCPICKTDLNESKQKGEQ
ncbi:hypothetical protein C9374_009589 [Naegleria lovaniensis]|uniref:RING-type domain-containing protein n=1 Tax=Naegleria lovaniensis TaxID=51637 RepID=A0AA88H537_NAELO|nr:uncharacterized protein C9374_009589 [Naegleria lovaniensis]KAG2393012.1 hypothetical protein C9374_009589 [Naegleria lovaniensis]